MTDTTTGPVGTSLALAAPSAPLVDVQKRTIEGLAVPFGPAGQTSAGRLQFSPGSLAFRDPSRVKLLREHDQRDAVGVGQELTELSAADVDARMVAAGREPLGLPGLWARFRVPEGTNGDAALAEAATGLRDAFSVGVQLDDATATNLRRSQGAAIQGRGALREVSLVSVPAFDDARVGSVAAHAELVVSSWSDPVPTREEPATVTTASTAPSTTTEAPPTTTDAAPATASTTTTGQPAAPAATPAPAPVAAAGAAVVTGNPSTYTFASDGPSLVVDAYRARFDGHAEAAERMARFNAELADGNQASVMALAAVMQTTDPDSGAVIKTGHRPDLLRVAVDRGRPLNSRVRSIPIRNATPFLIPSVNGFTGVADHTQGTAHVPEGTLDLGESTVTPRALSGAFRMSREMVDASNPAIDRIALAAMLKDYRKVSEARLATALMDVDTDATGGITTVQGVRTELVAFGNDDVEAGVVLAGKGFLQALILDVDADGRPLLPFVAPSNASGQIRAGYTGAYIDGVEVAKSSALPTERALILDPDVVLVAESQAQQFRFEEVEGPGIVKLALFGYYAAAVLDPAGVHELATTAEPVA